MASIIGTNPEQIPTNGMLGPMAWEDPDSFRAVGFTVVDRAADPTVADIPPGYGAIFRNTTTGDVKLWVNIGGTLKSGSALV